jgi:hypothetical protein
MDMLPSHRIMKQGKTVYDDDDKYSKHDKPWSVRKAWRQVRSALHLEMLASNYIDESNERSTLICFRNLFFDIP